jgi:Cytoskeletal-regulatory complex EF hand
MAEQIEQKYYNKVFSKTDNGSGKIEGRQAVALFKTSGLPIQVLKQIWTLATPNQEDHLDKNRFFVALKLIALAQDNKSVSIQFLHEKTNLPRFEGIELPQPGDDWEVGENEMNVYINGFKKLSVDKGYLTGSESKELLQRTQFSPVVLKKLWTLIGLDSTGTMGQEQFIVAMQLIAKVRQGIELPETLPGSLDKIINKPKLPDATEYPKLDPLPSKPLQETKSPEVIRLKDPEPHIVLPKPISKSTLSESPQESPRTNVHHINALNLEKNILEKEKIIKEKTTMLKDLSEMLEYDQTELELLKEKNKILDEKNKQCEENYNKIQGKIIKAKDKLSKEILKSKSLVESLKKENFELQEKIKSAKTLSRNDDPSPSDLKPISKKDSGFDLPKKDPGFEFDNFFKTPLSGAQLPVDPPKKDPLGLPKPVEALSNFGFGSEIPENPLKKDPSTNFGHFETQKLEDPKKEPEKFQFFTNSSLFPTEANFSQSTSTQPTKIEQAPIKKPETLPELKPIGIPKPIIRDDDIFAGLDKPFNSGPPIRKESSSSSSADNASNPPDASFGFKFGEDFEKKIEKPSGFEFKPDAMAFPTNFDGFSKGFAFPNAAQSFDSDFFKIDTSAIRSQGKPREPEFD